jgi:hypothetical protein
MIRKEAKYIKKIGLLVAAACPGGPMTFSLGMHQKKLRQRG